MKSNSAFGAFCPQRYWYAPNSQSAKDVTELVIWLGGGALPESVSAVRFDPKALRDVTPRRRLEKISFETKVGVDDTASIFFCRVVDRSV
jgi:hypothetical protein